MVLKQLGDEDTAMHFDPADECQASITNSDATTTQRGIQVLLCYYYVKDLVS